MSEDTNNEPAPWETAPRTAADDVAEYLNLIYGDREGVMILSGKDPATEEWQREMHLEWPTGRHKAVTKIVRLASDYDVYVCTHLMMRAERRNKGNAVARETIHADIDGEFDAELVRSLGGFAVAS